jgi:putative transposase
LLESGQRRAQTFADGGYSGEAFNFYILEHFDMLVEVVKRTEKGFRILSKRWVVERTFAWLDGCRRLAKDYEFSIQSSQGFMDLACLQLCVRRLAA